MEWGGNASNASVHFNWAQSTIGDVNNITLVLEHARRAIHKLLTMADAQYVTLAVRGLLGHLQH